MVRLVREGGDVGNIQGLTPQKKPGSLRAFRKIADQGGSAELFESRFDRLEVRHLARVVVALGVLNDPGTVDDESGTLRHTAHVEIFLREETLVSDAVGLGYLVLVVTEEGDFDAFFFFPVLLGKGVVTADAVDFGIEVGILGEFARDGAKLLRATAGEGHGDKEEEDIAVAEEVHESDGLGAVGADRGQLEVGCIGAY